MRPCKLNSKQFRIHIVLVQLSVEQDNDFNVLFVKFFNSFFVVVKVSSLSGCLVLSFL